MAEGNIRQVTESTSAITVVQETTETGVCLKKYINNIYIYIYIKCLHCSIGVEQYYP